MRIARFVSAGCYIFFSIVVAEAQQEFVNPKTAAANELFLEAFEKRRINECESAIDLFKTGLRISPNRHLPHYYIADCYKELGMEEEMKDSYQKVFDLAPNSKEAYKSMAIIEPIIEEQNRIAQELVDQRIQYRIAQELVDQRIQLEKNACIRNMKVITVINYLDYSVYLAFSDITVFDNSQAKEFSVPSKSVNLITIEYGGFWNGVLDKCQQMDNVSVSFVINGTNKYHSGIQNHNFLVLSTGSHEEDLYYSDHAPETYWSAVVYSDRYTVVSDDQRTFFKNESEQALLDSCSKSNHIAKCLPIFSTKENCIGIYRSIYGNTQQGNNIMSGGKISYSVGRSLEYLKKPLNHTTLLEKCVMY